MSEIKDGFVRRTCTKSPKRYADVLSSGDESKDYDVYDPYFGVAHFDVAAAKKAPAPASAKMFSGYSEIRNEDSLVGYDGYSRAICVAFLGNKGEIENCWIPLDALKNDARYNPEFLLEIEKYAAEEDEKFWTNPPRYIEMADKDTWDLPRSSVTQWHSTIVKDPFVAMTLPKSECAECLIFFKLSARKFNGGTTYTLLKVLIESLMGGGHDAIARNVLRFARNYTEAMHYFLASGDETKIRKFFGFPIILDDLARKMIGSPVAGSAEKSRNFLQSINPNYAREMLRPVAEKYLRERACDMQLLSWFKSTDAPTTTPPPPSLFTRNVLLKMEALIDKLSTKPRSPLILEVAEADIEASDAPFNYEGKTVDFSAVGGGKRKKRESPGVMPADIEDFDLPEDFAGKRVKFFMSPTRVITDPAERHTKLDVLAMVASMSSRDEQTKDNGPFALRGFPSPYKKRDWSAFPCDMK